MHTAASHLPNNGSMPRDLRGGGPADAGAGKTYDVDPAAVERLRAYWQQKFTPCVDDGIVDEATQKGAIMSDTPDITFDQWQAARASNGAAVSTKVDTPPLQVATKVDTPQAAVPAISPTKGELLILDPTAVYPAEVIQAAKEQEASDGRRDLTKILTDDVLAIWHRWNTTGGVGMAAIGKKRLNGLIDVHLTQVSAYLAKYRERLASAELAEPSAAMLETAVAKVASEEPAAQTAVPATSPGRKAVIVKKAVIEPEPAADVRAQTPVDEPETAVVEELVAESAVNPEQEPDIEPLQTAVEPFAPHRPENMPPWLDRQWAPPPAPRPGDALGALVQLLNDERITVKGSVKLNVEIEFGG